MEYINDDNFERAQLMPSAMDMSSMMYMNPTMMPMSPAMMQMSPAIMTMTPMMMPLSPWMMPAMMPMYPASHMHDSDDSIPLVGCVYH